MEMFVELTDTDRTVMLCVTVRTQLCVRTQWSGPDRQIRTSSTGS